MSTFFASTEFLRMQDKTIYSKLEYFVQNRGCVSAAVQILPHSTGITSQLVPLYPYWGTMFVCRPYMTLFLSTKKFVAGQIKNIVVPASITTASHKIFIISDEEGEHRRRTLPAAATLMTHCRCCTAADANAALRPSCRRCRRRLRFMCHCCRHFHRHCCCHFQLIVDCWQCPPHHCHRLSLNID